MAPRDPGPDWGSVNVSAVRMTRVYPQSALTQEDLTFTWRVQSEFPFVIETGTLVQVRSGITENMP